MVKLGIGIAIASFMMLQIPLHDYLVDDTYIHLTFAKNLVNGNGFSFNPDEPTYGVTAPLWTVLLSLFAYVFHPTPLLAKLLSVLFGAFSIPGLYRLCRQLNLKTGYALSVAMLWAVNVWHIRWAASGMETTLAVLLLLMGFSAHLKQRSHAGIFLGLAVLCRPESAVLIVMITLELIYYRHWKKAILFIVNSAIMILPWLIYAVAEFGTIYPNPALIKAQSGSLLLSDFFLGLKRVFLILGGAHGLELIILITGIGWMWRRNSKFIQSLRPFYIILVIWAIFPTIFYLSRGVFITSRYMMIGIPPLLIVAFLTLQALEEYEIGMIIHRYWRSLVFFLIIIQITLTLTITLPHIEAFQPTMKALKELALQLRETTPLGSSVAIGDVGVVGYYANRYVIDLEGLVSPQVIPYRVGKHLDQVIFNESYWNFKKPDFIIDKAVEFRRLSRHFGQRYRILSVISIPGGLVDTADERWYYTLYKIE